MMKDGGEGRGKKRAAPFIVLLSSLPRSGSTMVAELLSSSMSNAVLFFEPLSIHRKELGFQNGSCVADFIKELSDCSFERDFEVWLKDKSLFLQYFHPEVLRCFQKPREGGSACRRKLDLRGLCFGAEVKIAKVIRSRLSWLEDLLRSSSETSEVKVVHITRDPRASLNSLSNLGWRRNSASRCLSLESDLNEFEGLVLRYPKRLHHLSLEELSVQPKIVSERLFSFLFGNATLPAMTRRFLESHLYAQTPTRGSMSTHKDSRKEYQAWRWRISAEELRDVEEDPACRRTIQRLGHVIFGSREAARNRSLPL